MPMSIPTLPNDIIIKILSQVSREDLRNHKNKMQFVLKDIENGFGNLFEKNGDNVYIQGGELYDNKTFVFQSLCRMWYDQKERPMPVNSKGKYDVSDSSVEYYCDDILNIEYYKEARSLVAHLVRKQFN